MTDRELMHQALDALEYLCETTEAESVSPYEAITALRDRLAQPEQELMIDCPRCGHCCTQRPWVGLTMADMAELRQGGWHNISDERFRVIEAKIKEKNT